VRRVGFACSPRTTILVVVIIIILILVTIITISPCSAFQTRDPRVRKPQPKQPQRLQGHRLRAAARLLQIPSVQVTARDSRGRTVLDIAFRQHASFFRLALQHQAETCRCGTPGCLHLATPPLRTAFAALDISRSGETFLKPTRATLCFSPSTPFACVPDTPLVQAALTGRAAHVHILLDASRGLPFVCSRSVPAAVECAFALGVAYAAGLGFWKMYIKPYPTHASKAIMRALLRDDRADCGMAQSLIEAVEQCPHMVELRAQNSKYSRSPALVAAVAVRGGVLPQPACDSRFTVQPFTCCVSSPCLWPAPETRAVAQTSTIVSVAEVTQGRRTMSFP